MLSSTIMFLNMCELYVVKCLFSEDGVFKGSAKLAAGDYIYKFFVDGEWQVDESQVSQSVSGYHIHNPSNWQFLNFRLLSEEIFSDC